MRPAQGAVAGVDPQPAYRRAAEICDEDAEICRRIGENGLAEIKRLKPRGDRINALTHCNAGWLATVDWGTALAPIYKAHEDGVPVHVYKRGRSWDRALPVR